MDKLDKIRSRRHYRHPTKSTYFADHFPMWDGITNIYDQTKQFGGHIGQSQPWYRWKHLQPHPWGKRMGMSHPHH